MIFRFSTTNTNPLFADLSYLWPELDELHINDTWFQQNGATSQTARVTIDLLKGKFGERVSSRNGPVE